MLHRLRFRWRIDQYFDSVRRYSTSPGYIILLPELPTGSDSQASSNELLNIGKIPSDFKVSPKKCQEAVGITSLTFESAVWKTEQALQDPNYDIATELLKDLDSTNVDYVTSLLNMVHILHNLPNYEELLQRITIAKNLKFQSKPIYYTCKDLLDSNPRSRELQNHVYMSKINGVELTPQAYEHFIKVTKELPKLKQKFKKNVSTANTKFKHLIVDDKHLGNMTENEMKQIAKDRTSPTKGPWYITLNKQVYTSFLENCPVPALRWNLWQAFNNRCADSKHNSVTIEEIRGTRRSVAKILGYRNATELALENKLAANVNNVKSMIATLLLKSRSAHAEEIERLNQFAANNGYNSKLKPWDIPYWRKVERETLYNVQNMLFPYSKTLNSLLEFTSEIFGIKYNRKNEQEYSVLRNGTEVGSFVIDPFKSSTKFPGNYVIGNRMFSMLVLNLDTPSRDQDTMLTLTDVNVLFENFGLLLQTSINARNRTVGLVQDFKIVGHFLSMWLGNKDFVHKFMGLEGDALENFLKARKHFAASDLCYELYQADLDLELDLCDTFWNEVVKKLWATYNAFDLDKNQHLCSSPLIQYGSTYYSDLWSRMLGADCYRAFVEHKETRSASAHGERFCNTIFEASENSHPSEIFRSFRGRDPSPDAFLWSLGLMKMEKGKAD